MLSLLLDRWSQYCSHDIIYLLTIKIILLAVCHHITVLCSIASVSRHWIKIARDWLKEGLENSRSRPKGGSYHLHSHVEKASTAVAQQKAQKYHWDWTMKCMGFKWECISRTSANERCVREVKWQNLRRLENRRYSSTSLEAQLWCLPCTVRGMLVHFLIQYESLPPRKDDQAQNGGRFHTRGTNKKPILLPQ